jgi:hypothetical protein
VKVIAKFSRKENTFNRFISRVKMTVSAFGTGMFLEEFSFPGPSDPPERTSVMSYKVYFLICIVVTRMYSIMIH